MDTIVRHGRPTRCCLPLQQWPEADMKAWFDAIKPGSLFDEPGLGANWAPATMAGVRRGYGRWLLWLSHTMERYAQMPLADRVTRAAVAEYVAFLRTTTADTSTSAYISFLHSAARAMAPDRDWTWMKTIYMRLKRDTPIVRRKRHRIRSTMELFQLGIDLMHNAHVGLDIPTLDQARQYRNGFIVALLAIRPLRAKNFVALALGETLIKRSECFWISFGREATKTHAPIEQPFPKPLVSHLTYYIDHVRPYLMARRHSRSRRGDVRQPGSALWISADGGPLNRAGFAGGSKP